MRRSCRNVRNTRQHRTNSSPASAIRSGCSAASLQDGLEQPASEEACSGANGAAGLLLRSPLRVEVDGSLRMSAPIPQGAVVHLMTGDPDACLQAARDAAGLALQRLNEAKPLLAVALVDAAWQLLFEARPTALAAALQEALGDVPLVGAYTFGQLDRPDLEKPPLLHNQNLAVLVLGEAQE